MIKEMNSRETRALELIAALYAKVVGNESVLESRLKLIPNGWRDYRLISSRIDTLMGKLYETVPNKTLLHLDKLLQYGEVAVRFRPAARTDEYVLLMPDDVKTLVNISIAERCSMCFEDRAGVKKCELRKALMNVTPPIDVTIGDCPYRYVYEHNEKEKYI